MYLQRKDLHSPAAQEGCSREAKTSRDLYKMLDTMKETYKVDVCRSWVGGLRPQGPETGPEKRSSSREIKTPRIICQLVK